MYTNGSPERLQGKTLRSLSLALASSAVVMAFVGAAMPNPAMARDQTSPRQEIVRYHDLDLTNVADTERLNSRIRRAAKRVCDEPGVAGIWLQRKTDHCIEKAHDRAWSRASNLISQRRFAVRVGN